MDIFEKQQTIEAIKTVVKGRWFYAAIIFLQGVIIRLFFPAVPLASTLTLSLILASAFVFNFGYWIYLRRPPEKMSSWGLQIVKAIQVVMDQIWFSTVIYFSGTVGKMIIVTYIFTIMNGASLYKKKGVILSTLSCQFFFTILAVLQYKGFMKTDVPVKEVFSFNIGEKQWLPFVLIAFYSYTSATAVFAAFLASLFRKREGKLQIQKDELVEKTQVLTHQTQELTQTKDWLHDALTKSDKARVESEEARAEAEKARQELGKANLELKAKIDELEKYGKVTVGREIRMVELKSEIKNLKETVRQLQSQLGQK